MELRTLGLNVRRFGAGSGTLERSGLYGFSTHNSDMPVEVPGTIYGAGFCAPPEQASTFGISELNLCGHCGSAATTCPGLEGSEIRKDRHGYFLMFCTREASNLTLGDQGAVSDGVFEFPEIPARAQSF